MLACVCKATADALLASKWRSAVRIARIGYVLEPAAGAFDVTVAPGEDVQAAVDACPPSGCVLLLSGTHAGPLVLNADKELHVFGRGRATLRTSTGIVLSSEALRSTVDGLAVRREAGELDVGVGGFGVVVKGGALRLQGCDLTCAANGACLCVDGGADPVVASCRCARGVGPSRGSFCPY